MSVHQHTLNIATRGQVMKEITDKISGIVAASRQQRGVVTVFCQHTSCSLVIMENADPSARHDLEQWLSRLVPENDPEFTHTFEGADDMPSHIKMALTRTWQGVFLWEHRRAPHTRRLIVSVQGE
jgi:secondary thiamine-phosphate synthase enzyme